MISVAANQAHHRALRDTNGNAGTELLNPSMKRKGLTGSRAVSSADWQTPHKHLTQMHLKPGKVDQKRRRKVATVKRPISRRL